MSHYRTTIRQAVVARLIDATDCGKHVYANRSQKLYETELPALLIYTRSDASEIGLAAPKEYKRTLKLGVEIVGRANDNLDDQLDAICEQVERLMFKDGDDTLGGVVSEVVLGETDIDIVSDGNKPEGGARITFDMIYWSKFPAQEDPDDADDFEKVGLKVDVNPGGRSPKAESEFDLNGS